MTAFTQRILLATQRRIDHPQAAESLRVIGLLAHNLFHLNTRRSKCRIGASRIIPGARAAKPSKKDRGIATIPATPGIIPSGGNEANALAISPASRRQRATSNHWSAILSTVLGSLVTTL